ncbi:MAG: hypothetical protein N4A43_03545 [Alphaproteobacteria bacterium]|jgi:hypothetical protein|nr:hypothetical protein [Alphaproteobacteria bacterium]
MKNKTKTFKTISLLRYITEDWLFIDKNQEEVHPDTNYYETSSYKHLNSDNIMELKERIRIFKPRDIKAIEFFLEKESKKYIYDDTLSLQVYIPDFFDDVTKLMSIAEDGRLNVINDFGKSIVKKYGREITFSTNIKPALKNTKYNIKPPTSYTLNK